MPIRGYIIHNNFIVILSCEITFIFSGFNLNGRSPTDCIRLEGAKPSSRMGKEKKEKKKRKEVERRDKCMHGEDTAKGTKHGGLKGKHVCDAYRRRTFFFIRYVTTAGGN